MINLFGILLMMLSLAGIIVFLLASCFVISKIITKMKYIFLIKNLENKYNCLVLPIIHTQKYECINDKTYDMVMNVIEKAIKENKKKIFVILHTPGGTVFHANRIADVIKETRKTLGIEFYGIIPHYAMSGGTLISLALDKIIATDAAVIGPLDPQIPYENNYYSIRDMIKASYEYDISNEGFAVICETGKRTMREIRNKIVELVKNEIDDDTKISNIVYELLDSHSHGHGILIRKLLDYKFELITSDLYFEISEIIKYKK